MKMLRAMCRSGSSRWANPQAPRWWALPPAGHPDIADAEVYICHHWKDSIMPESSCKSNQEFFSSTLDLDADTMRQPYEVFGATLTATPAAPALPEAPISVNVRVDIGGLCHQVTARGHSGPEAAANLTSAIDALRATFEAPVQPTREQRLRGMLHCALLEAVRASNLALARRLDRAAELVRANAIAPTMAEGIYAVQSQSDPTRQYIVYPDGGGCDCASGQQGGTCKHLMCIDFYRRLVEPDARRETLQGDAR